MKVLLRALSTKFFAFYNLFSGKRTYMRIVSNSMPRKSKVWLMQSFSALINKLRLLQVLSKSGEYQSAKVQLLKILKKLSK